MARKVIISGLLGAVVLMLWTFIVNGLFRFRADIDMKHVEAEQLVYDVLKENIKEPGRYTVNPGLTPDGRFPMGEPVYGVMYGGVGHEAAGKQMILGLFIFLLVPITGAWLLSQTSAETLASYGRKVLFFTAIGFIFALFADLSDTMIASYPISDAIKIAVHDIIMWTVVGLAVAWRMKPASA